MAATDAGRGPAERYLRAECASTDKAGLAESASRPSHVDGPAAAAAARAGAQLCHTVPLRHSGSWESAAVRNLASSLLWDSYSSDCLARSLLSSLREQTVAEERAVSGLTVHAQGSWRRAFAIVCAVLALSYGYFFSGGGWNQASRFALVRAIVEQHTVRIDSYHEVTGDKAERDGHYYCDKAPGLSLLAVPVVVAARPVLKVFGVDAKSQAGLTWLAYIATFAVSSLPAVGGAAALMWLGRRLGAEAWQAALGALTVGLGTPTFAYAILFWGHATAGACLVGSLAVGVAALEAGAPRARSLLAAATGFLLAFGALVEYPAFGAGVIIGVALLYVCYRTRGLAFTARFVGLLALGALGPCVLLLAYQKVAFGSPFTLSYSKVQGFDGMKEGFFGITVPRPHIIWKLLQGSRRGLVWLAPCLFVVPAGFYLLHKRFPGRGAEAPGAGQSSLTTTTIVRVALAVFAFYLLLNASYHYWDGGFTYGPRHVGPALPFLGLGIVAACWGPIWLQRATHALAAFSVVLTVVAMAVNSMPPATFKSLHTSLYLPAFVRGKLAQNDSDFFGLGATRGFNLGERLGLHGAASLLPLFMVWAIALVWLLRDRPRTPRVRTEPELRHATPAAP